MKRSIFGFLTMITFAIVSCTKENISSDLVQVASSGTWRVTLFTDSGNDETSNFNGYSFTFSGSTVTAVKGGTSKSGAWSVNSSSQKFNIDLGPKDNTNKPLGDLTNNWKILSNSTTEIRLTDDNSSSNEFVTFTKN